MYLTKAGSIVKILTGRVGMSVEIVDQPWRGEDPVFKTFVVVPVLRVGSQHAIEDRTGEAGPFSCFRYFSIQRIGRNPETSHGNESVILAIGDSATGLGFEIISQHTRLLDYLV